jgi:hypothetical protein
MSGLPRHRRQQAVKADSLRCRSERIHHVKMPRSKDSSLRIRDFPVEVINRVKDSKSLFLVFVGNYLTYDEAKSRIDEIWKSYRVESFVVSR